MELVIADPSNTNGTKSSNFQTLFTKQNKAAQSLAFQDLCSRVLKHYDDLRSGTKFLMKQFLMESSKQGQRSMQAIKSMENLKRENTSLKQLLNSERVKTEQTIESYQQQLTAAQRKIEGKEQQLMKFRSLHQTMTPESPRGRNNEARRVSGEGMGVPQPPIKGFMIQKEAHERAKQRAMEPPQRAPVLGGHPHSHSGRQAQSYISQVNTMPQQRHSSSQQRHPSSSRSHGSGGGSSVGIRDFTSSTQYAFSSGGNKRRRTPQERVQQARAMSPSQAFAAQPPGSYSTARGPASYFQQGYGRR